MLTQTDFTHAFAGLSLSSVPVMAHASLSAFGEVEGGAQTVVDALVASFPAGVMMPTHTYKPMVTPLVGPAHNGIDYQRWNRLSAMAEFYSPDMPADVMMGIIPETLRRHSRAKRSRHPILSFSGIGVDDALAAQTLDDPFAPIRVMAERGAWVLLLGVNHTVNTSIHLAEKLAGRRQFVRWALTEEGIIACPGFPGCSAGFWWLEPSLAPFSRKVEIGAAEVTAVPMARLFGVVVSQLRANPAALICDDDSCERCNEFRLVP